MRTPCKSACTSGILLSALLLALWQPGCGGCSSRQQAQTAALQASLPTPVPMPAQRPAGPVAAAAAPWSNARDGSILLLVSPGARGETGSFWIGRDAVDNQQFARFLNEVGMGQSEETPWYYGKDLLIQAGACQPRPGLEHLPASGVTWQGAAAYCQWAGGRLPSEDEWLRAAMGPLPSCPLLQCNRRVVGLLGYHEGMFPVPPVPDVSPAGCRGMAGGPVWE